MKPSERNQEHLQKIMEEEIPSFLHCPGEIVFELYEQEKSNIEMKYYLTFFAVGR